MSPTWMPVLRPAQELCDRRGERRALLGLKVVQRAGSGTLPRARSLSPRTLVVRGPCEEGDAAKSTIRRLAGRVRSP